MRHRAPTPLAALPALGALALGGCDGLFVTRIDLPLDGGAWLAPPPADDGAVAPAPDAGDPADAGSPPEPIDAGSRLPESDAAVLVEWGDGELVLLPDAGGHAPDGALPEAAPRACLLADDRAAPPGPGGSCPPEECFEPRRSLALRSEQAVFACLDAPSTSYCSAELVAQAEQRERVSFGSALPHRSLYVLTAPDLSLELELDAAVLGAPTLTGLAASLIALHGSVLGATGAHEELRCAASDTTLESLVDGVLQLSALCRVEAASRTVEVPLYLDTRAPLPALSSELACAYHDLAPGALDPPLVDLTLRAPIVFAP